MTPVETKVTAASLGAAIGGLLAWLLNTYAPHALDGLQPLIDIAGPVLAALILGWLAPHTHRPDLAAQPPPDAASG